VNKYSLNVIFPLLAQISMFSMVINSIKEEFRDAFAFHQNGKKILLLSIMVVSYGISLLCVTRVSTLHVAILLKVIFDFINVNCAFQGGLTVLLVFDEYFTKFSPLVGSFCFAIAVFWIWGKQD